MARHFRWALTSVLAVALTVGLVEAHGQSDPQTQSQQPQPAQPAADGRRDGPHERRDWWKNPRDMAEIGITAEQSAAIDGIFRAEIEKMKALRETLMRLEQSLNEVVRANTADVAVFTHQVEKIEKKRAELNTIRTVMLYRMRRVLTADQNARLRAMFDRWEAARRKQDGDRRR